MSDRITLQLGVIGATHQAESVIALLTGSSRVLTQHGRDGFHNVMSDAETMALALLKTIQRTRDDNWNARCAEYDTARRPVPTNVVRLPFAHRSTLQGA